MHGAPSGSIDVASAAGGWISGQSLLKKKSGASARSSVTNFCRSDTIIAADG
jgi:hypothetical protein